MNKTREEVRLLIGALRDLTANQPPLPGIYPDYEAPIVRFENGQRIIANARWGLLSPRSAGWRLKHDVSLNLRSGSGKGSKPDFLLKIDERTEAACLFNPKP